ncbi:sugar kinase [Devosia sp. PTR5]|uniref:Sugar kinase n=1 Tax=Devosia oryzisoli TaxID=2774138 RepID=A0A927IUR3_9HYPH|nr:sugar kinase [Devosia oryzisoli]MBD8067128.1 sugar kinase [Devosia oryzisoli]
MSGTVLVIGDVMTDIIVASEGPIVPGSDRRAAIVQRPGGSGANQAVWLAAAGVPVRFAARVGAADLALYRDRFRQWGVEPCLAADATLGSGVLVTLLDPLGERSFLTDRGANLNLCTADLPATLLDGVELLLVSGYSLFAPVPRAAVQGLMRAARSRGVAIAVDPASTGFLAEVGPQNFLDWVGPLDWLFANDAEAEFLTGVADLDEQVRRLGAQFEHVIIKRGRFGATLGGRDGVTLGQAAPVVRAVDTTGAGDAFAAGFVAALLAGEAPETCLERGIANGTRAVQRVGGQPERP